MDSYTIIQEYLRDNQQEGTFSPKLLDSLNETQRRLIETEIALYCQKGHIQYLKFIPYLTTVEIENTLTPEILTKFPEDVKMEALKNLFLKTRNADYLKDITFSALQNVISFNNLINLALDERLNPSEQDAVKKIVNKVYDEKQDDINYKAIIDFKLAYDKEGFSKK